MSRRAIGYFVHHQGRGHAERCLALVNALPSDRPVTVFCASFDALGDLPAHVERVTLPSLFEPTGNEAPGLDGVPAPATVHCAPLGWPGIRHAMATLVDWFDRADPALFVSDVSAEVAQLARLCSVPHVCVLQHGERDDPGHRAAFDGAVGLLAPYDASLVQSNWSDELLARTHFAGGLGLGAPLPSREDARDRLGIGPADTVHLVLSGGGGDGFASAALGVGARAVPEASWHTIGHVRSSWHATEPANLHHHGWVDDAAARIASADLIIGTAGNTVCQQVLAAGVPWIVVPEWCYFDEQVCKARALADAGLAHALPTLPSHADAWRDAIAAARTQHDAERQRRCVRAEAATTAAHWLDALCISLWDEAPRVRGTAPISPTARPVNHQVGIGREHAIALNETAPSVLTIARGRSAHLHNLVLGLSRQQLPPRELVIGVMQPEPYEDLPSTDFPIRQIPIAGDTLPLALARNTVAREAMSDRLIFLDVDCIPAPSLVADYATALDSGDGLVMGEVRYLPEGAAADGWDYARFEREGVTHDHRAGPPAQGRARCEDYRCFWSLNFAMHREAFERAGGFDEGYDGYGGEDTDFARTLTERGITLHWLRGAVVYHQFHDQRMPPVAHVASVVRNAEYFAAKWGHRTMDPWLYCFGLLGLIEEGPDGLQLTGAAADPALLESLHEPGQPYASTQRAIKRLEAHARRCHERQSGSREPALVLDRKRFLHRPTRVAAA